MKDNVDIARLWVAAYAATTSLCADWLGYGSAFRGKVQGLLDGGPVIAAQAAIQETDFLGFCLCSNNNTRVRLPLESIRPCAAQFPRPR